MQALSNWVIYFKPTDHPEGYCARRFEVTDKVQATEDFIKDVTLEQLRERFESMGLVNMGRSPEDDPVIKEIWI